MPKQKKDMGKELAMHIEHWEWYYDQDCQQMCTLLGQRMALLDEIKRVEQKMVEQIKKTQRTDFVREETAIALKVVDGSNKHFKEYSPKGFVMQPCVRYL